VSFTIGILSFYPLPIQPRMSNYWIWTFFFFALSAGPLCFASRESIQTAQGRRMEAYICKSIRGCMQRYRQGHCGKTSQGCCGEGKELECRVTLSSISPFTQSIPIPPIHTRLSIYQHKASQASSSKQKSIQRCPCNREASASLPRIPFPWALASNFCAVLEFNSETTVQI